jgi:glycerol-3-phosphate dehydrogenase
MKRNVKLLADSPFDVLVIGGGIYGAWTAYDAALRGLRVAIVEKNDWASGTSSASSKLLHGGLRYLEQLHFGLVRKSLEERRLLSRLAPHQVHPLRFLIPLYRDARVGRFRLQTGLWLYDRLAGNDQPVAPHRSLRRREVCERFPFLSPDNLTGGLIYGDCQTDDALMVIEIISGAVAAGAAAVNYAEATSLIKRGDRVVGARVRDTVGGEEFEIEASIVVNAAGPWAPSLTDNNNDRLRLSKGVHLLLPALPTNDAMLIMSHRDMRVFFIIPWYGRTLLGTTDSDYEGDPGDVSVNDGDIAYLLEEANRVLGGVRWGRDDIVGSFAGVRALKYEAGKSPDSVTREWVMESPLEGLLVSTGGKYTSSRADATEIVDRVMKWLGKRAVKSPTATRPLPWSPVPADAEQEFAAWKQECIERGMKLGMREETASLGTRYGVHIDEIHELIRAESGLAERIHPDLPFTFAEAAWAAQHGMTVSIDDILRRRMPLSILADLNPDVIQRVIELTGASQHRRA